MLERKEDSAASPPAWSAVVVAAGRGSRMGTAEPKQYLALAGKPILLHALERFEAMPEIGEIVLVTGADEIGRCEALCAAHGLRKVRRIVAGGAERQQSVHRGLAAATGEWVLVHDAVRPLVTPEAVRRCMAQAEAAGAAVLAVPVKDTIKVVDEAGRIAATPDRRTLRAVQTPQAFRRELLLACHERAAARRVRRDRRRGRRRAVRPSGRRCGRRIFEREDYDAGRFDGSGMAAADRPAGGGRRASGRGRRRQHQRSGQHDPGRTRF